MTDVLTPTHDDSAANSTIAPIVDVPHFVTSVPFAAPKYIDTSGASEIHE